MRLILDTNILISALITVGGLANRLWEAWRIRRFTLVTSDEQFEEFRRVTRYPRLRDYIQPADAGTMLNELRDRAMVLRDLPTVEVSSDPADNFLLAMAGVSHADYLVTNDQRGLLSLGHYGSTRIVTLREIVAIVER
jgi:putative PIN family toxin of toxin-antitoxin system